MRLLLCLLCLSLSVPAWSMELWREWLEVDGTSFPVDNIKARSAHVRGSVLLVLGSGPGGAWPHSLAALAESLPDKGWNVLAARIDVDMDTPEQLLPRTNKALDALPTAAGRPTVVIAAGDIMRRLSLMLLDKTFSKQPSAMIGINRPAFDSVQQSRDFHALQLAVLDVVSGPDIPRLELRRRSQLATESGQSHYSQLFVPPTAPNWNGAPDRLSKQIIGWLNRSYSAG